MNKGVGATRAGPRYLLGAALLLSVLAKTRVFAFDAHRPFDIAADMIDFVDASQNMTAEGHVVVVQASATLHADYLQYDRQAGWMHARGNVILHENGSVFFGDALEYDLAAETGTLVSGKIYAAPWRLQAASWERKEDYYIGRNAAFTSCDLIDPHYHIRSTRIHIIPDQFFWAWNNRVYVDRVPVLYSPFLFRDLGPHRLVFQAQPGHDTVNGTFVKTATTYRFTENVYDKFLLDNYSGSGTGFGDELDYRAQNKYKGSLFGYYINPHADTQLTGAPNTPQYNIRSYHWQQMPHRIVLQSNVNIRNNVSFNDQYFQQDTNQAINDITSSVALTQQGKKINQRLVVEALQAPDTLDVSTFSTTHVQTASLPRYEFSSIQIPIWSPHVSSGPALSNTTIPLSSLSSVHHIGPLNFNTSGFLGQDYERADRQTRGKGNVLTNFSQSFQLSKHWVYTPALNQQLNWQDKYDPLPTALTPVSSTATIIPIGFFRGYQGRLGTSQLVRYRPNTSLTLDQTYSLTDRLAANGASLDRSLPDGGVETHRLGWLLYWRPNRTILLRSYSGYDLRRIADETPEAYRQRRVDPWTSELTLLPKRSRFDYFFREQVSWYPTQSSLWEATGGYSAPYHTRIAAGLLYNNGQRGLLTLNNRISLYASPAWRVDAIYHAFIPNIGLAYLRRSTMNDASLILSHDMHCWQTQFIYRYLPPFNQSFSFLVNLKLGGSKERDIADQDLESQFYPWRDRTYAP